MKKIFLLGALLLCTLTASAQFEQGVKYANASLSGLGFSYSGSEKFRFGLSASAGYFLIDNVMLKADFSYDHRKHADDVSLGAGARYYFDSVGIFVGAGLEFAHWTKSHNAFRLPIEVGYAFFVNKNITIEPALYYKMSFNDFAHNSEVGVRLGAGIYF